MADCITCGDKLGFFAGDEHRRCNRCAVEGKFPPDHPSNPDIQKQIKENQIQLDSEIEAVLLTTESYSDLKILNRLEIVTAECAFGMNIFKDLFSGVRDIVGGRSEAVQKTMRDSRKVALYELKKEAHAVGANAVVGVDLDYVELSGVGNMIMLVASGTAVVVDVN